MKTEITAVEIIKLGHLTLRTVGHNQHGAYVAIDDDRTTTRVAFFKFSDEQIHCYEGSTPAAEQQTVIDQKISPWFKITKNFNRAARAWNSMNLPPVISLKGTEQ